MHNERQIETLEEVVESYHQVYDSYPIRDSSGEVVSEANVSDGNRDPLQEPSN